MSKVGWEVDYMNYIDRMLSKLLPNKVYKKRSYRKKYKHIRKSKLGLALKRNRKLKNIHKGSRCFVLGNGPSLSEVDLSKLSDEITFTVNDLYYKEDFEKIHTDYHVFSDPYYFGELGDIINILTSKTKLKGIFLEGSGYQNKSSKGLEDDYPIYYFTNGIEIEDVEFMNMDLCKLLPYYCTVVQSAISIAVYMGFKEIYLLGCDCTGILNFIERSEKKDITNYAYKLPDKEKEKQESIVISCEHMFFEWHHIFKSYRLLNSYFKQKDIKLINLTEGGILDCIEKGNLKDVIQSK